VAGQIYKQERATTEITDINGHKYKVYPLSETTYGQPDGLFGINCGHRPRGVTDGLFTRSAKTKDEYGEDDKELYTKICRQRELERRVRKAKTEAEMLEVSGDVEGAKEMRKKAAAYNKQLREYCQQNGLKYRDDRVRTYGKITAKKPDKDLTGGGNADIIETDNIVDLCARLPSQKDNKPAFSSEDIIQIETELQRIPEKHRNVIEQTVKHVAIAQTSDGSYNPVSKTLKLKPGVIHETFIHECGHVLADAYKVYDDPEFIDILCDGVNLNPYSMEMIFYEPKQKTLFFAKSDKFISPYQGRCYIDMSTFNWGENLSPKYLLDYISVGYETYFNDPTLLREKDPKLFDYIERKMIK